MQLLRSYFFTLKFFAKIVIFFDKLQKSSNFSKRKVAKMGNRKDIFRNFEPLRLKL
jgi:hypothetical protein